MLEPFAVSRSFKKGSSGEQHQPPRWSTESFREKAESKSAPVTILRKQPEVVTAVQSIGTGRDLDQTRCCSFENVPPSTELNADTIAALHPR